MASVPPRTSILTHNRRAAAVPISIAGSDVPIFLLDGTAMVVRATPTTTVGAACFAISTRLGLVSDAHHALFERGPDNEFRVIDDAMTIARVLSHWDDQASYLSGACVFCVIAYLKCNKLCSTRITLTLPYPPPLFLPISIYRTPCFNF